MKRKNKSVIKPNLHYKNAVSSSTHKIVKVSVAVPAHMKSRLARQVLVAPRISQRQNRSRHIRVPLQSVRKTVNMTVKVAVPRANKPRLAMMDISRGVLNLRSSKYVKKKIVAEHSSRRYNESKRWRHRASSGYLDSTKRDTGIIGANQFKSGERIADAALVNSAIGGLSW